LPRVAVIGGGPAGLAAAEGLAASGVEVDLYDAMRSVGRKFLLAGIGGLNLTHSESIEPFLARYGARRTVLEPFVRAFDPAALREWAHGLGVETFVGTSRRVFPREMKAAPLLRAWLRRLRAAGVRFRVQHRWRGWHEHRLRFATPQGERLVTSDAVVLALGGGSWPKLGSDGGWVPILRERAVDVRDLVPANCGFDVAWSAHLRERYAGAPLKSVILDYDGEQRRGECVVTASGVEGSLIYAFSARLRDAIAARGPAVIHLDLAPDRTRERLARELASPRASRSIANHWRMRAGIEGVKAALLREVLPAEALVDPARVAATIKALPLRLVAPRPLDEAISSAGGVAFDALDERLMLRARPGVFCAGEMLDWEAPTGGYLLTACFATGRAAARGALQWLRDEARAASGTIVAHAEDR
jgi:uncharacterized flavoprotein (TIGR03862 family)